METFLQVHSLLSYPQARVSQVGILAKIAHIVSSNQTKTKSLMELGMTQQHMEIHHVLLYIISQVSKQKLRWGSIMIVTSILYRWYRDGYLRLRHPRESA